MKILYTILAFTLVSINVYGQRTTNNFFTQKELSSAQKIDIPTSKAKYFSLDLNSLSGNLKSTQGRQSSTVVLPMPDGTVDEFQIKESVVMSARLAEKFPNIKTFVGTSIKNTSTSVRFDVSPSGFHAMMFTPKGTVYIDPVYRTNKGEYQSYYKRDFLPGHKGVFQEGAPIDYNPELTKQINEMVAKGVQKPSGTELRTYRLAVAATGEYTAFHGGTVEGALSGIVTTMNRVNGIYEREVSIRMVLVDNTDQLIFTDAATDGFSNSDANALIDEVQAKIDDIIGDANYDIGHGVSTGGGGLAGLGVPCQTGRKGSGITGSSQPVGDPYDVDFVAHEIGHQFGGNHTFNGSSGNCAGGNRSGGSAYEPGSGTTIMAYAGICSGQNIQNNSDAYFHTQSFDQIIAYTTLSQGNSCAAVSFTGNSAPIVDAGEGGFTIPISTPFKLDGSATDPDGDDLTYSWEQFDLGPAGAPGSPVGNAPLFRAFSPVSESYRLFPQISDILSNSSTMGEILPDYTRSLRFRLVARDNKDGGGGVDYDEISFDVSDQAGPFVVTEPNTAVNLTALATTTVTWDVANTNVAPVNCLMVNILLSTDGGITYPHTLVSNTNNDGNAVVLIPDAVTSDARIKVEAADNIFFDISNTNFNIITPSTNDFSLFVNNETPKACAPDDAIIAIQLSELGSFTTPITLSVTGLPAGYVTAFDTNPIEVGNTASLTISNTASESGTFDVEIEGESNGIVHTQEISLTILDGVLSATTLQAPLDLATNVDLSPTLTWDAVTGAESYQLQLALDAGFVNIVTDEAIVNELTYTVDSNLGSNTSYYWRVRADNSCGEGALSVVNSFSTMEVSCFDTFYSGDPVVISEQGTPTVSATIEVTENGTINDVNLKNLRGTHTYMEDLIVTLISPVGTEAILFSGICGSNNDFNLNLDDQSSESTIACPPTNQGTYKPLELLSIFNGESSQGMWTLKIEDTFAEDGGQLEEWSLEICIDGSIAGVPLAATALSSVPILSSQIDLTWTDNAIDETSYVVERSISNNQNFSELATLAANVSSYSDLTTEGGLMYFYRVKALNNGVSSSFSNESASTTPVSLPIAPSSLETESKSSEHVKIKWIDNSNTETSFTIERSVNNGSTYVVVANYPMDATSYVDVDVIPETIYFYRVKAANAQGESGYSNELEEIVPIALPAKASNFTATAISATEIMLAWDDNATDETGYKISRSLEDENNFVEIMSLTANSVTYTDSGLATNTKYVYHIVAVNSAGDSDYVSTGATTLNSLPPAPTALISENSVLKISLQWTDNADNEAEFVIERSVGDNSNFEVLGTVSSDVLSYDDTSLEQKTNYVYRVLARNNGGDSDYSNEVSAGLITGLADDLLKNSILIYPNPSTGVFNLKIVDAKLGKYDVVLTDIVGKVINNYSFEKQGSSSEQLFDLSNQPKGIYLIQISNGEGKSTHRLMKE